MSAVAVGLIAFILLMVLVLLGVHIGVSLMVMSVIGIYLSTGSWSVATNILGTTAFSSIREYTFGVIPLFVLMGLLANLSGASTELFNAADALLRKVKGGLGIATVAANAVFAAITGVSIASAAVFTKIALPPMERLGYDKKFAVGTVAGSSVLGMLIPPSVLMIVYGMLAEVSIGKLFIAGVLPGILLAVIYVIGISIMVRVKPDLINQHRADGAADTYAEGTRWKTILKPWPMILLIVITLGGIWGGFFTPIEAGGVGAFGALILVICKRKFTLKNMWDVLLETGITTGSVLFLLISAQMYSRMLAISGVVNMVGKAVINSGLAPMLVIVLFIVIMVILGCILDSTSILLLTVPLMVPIVESFGMDLVWYGIVAIVAIETGLLTPPFGLSVYTIKSSMKLREGEKGMEITEIFAGSMPFLAMMFVALLLIVVFPPIVTVLVP
jgi:C4-dicarboxylate transporter DctM subunit